MFTYRLLQNLPYIGRHGGHMRPGTLLPTGVAAKVRNPPLFPVSVWPAGYYTSDGVHLLRGHSHHPREEVQDSQ